MANNNFKPITKTQIERINFLARKSKSQGLTDEEKQEQNNLRNAYRAAFKASLSANLDNIYVLDDKGNEIKYKDYKKTDKKLENK